MKSFAILIFALVFALITAGQGLAAEKKLAPQESCPVMDIKINKEVFVDYEGKRVYFCCPKCREKFNADPAGYLKKMEEEGVDLENTPSLEHNIQQESEGKKHEHQHQH